MLRRDELDRLSIEHFQRFTLTYALTQPPADWAGSWGRGDAGLAREALPPPGADTLAPATCGQTLGLAVPELGLRACSGRAWRLYVGPAPFSAFPGQSPGHWAPQPLPYVLEPTASNVADSTWV